MGGFIIAGLEDLGSTFHPPPRAEQLLSPEERINVDEVHTTRVRARQSWTNNSVVVSIPRY